MKIKKIFQYYSESELFLLSIEPCDKTPHYIAPPGFSYEDLYPNDQEDYSFQLYLRPQLLLYLQVVFVIILSLCIFISSINESLWQTVLLISSLILINIIYYLLIHFFILNKPVLNDIWTEDKNKHLKYWFRHIPQRVKLKRESQELWFEGKYFNLRTEMQSKNYNKIWSQQKEIYYIALSSYFIKNNNVFLENILMFLPIIPSVLFIIIIIIDSFSISSCNYLLLSSYIPPMIICLSLFSLFLIITISKKKDELIFFKKNLPNELKNIPSYFKFDFENTTDSKKKYHIDNERNYNYYKQINTVFYALFLGAVVGLSNIQSMTNGSNKCSNESIYFHYVSIKKQGK